MNDNSANTPSENRSLPFYFGHLRDNTVDDFQWGRHHRAYLAYCHHNCTLKPHEMKAVCGYKNISKFQRRRAEWVSGYFPIPQVFLDMIGVELETLEECVRLDAQEYDHVLTQLPLPSFFVVRVIPAVCIRHEIEDANTLYDCYAAVQEAVDASPSFAAYIDWPELKLTRFQSGKEPCEMFWRPTLTVKQGLLSFKAPPTCAVGMRIG